MPKRHWSTDLSCQCGKRFRSLNAEAMHRHNFPALCRQPKEKNLKKQCCGTCSLLKVLPDSDGKIRIRKDRVYHCGAEIQWPLLPDSVRNFKLPYLGQVEPQQGENCTYWKKKIGEIKL